MKLQPQAASQYGLPQPVQTTFVAPVIAKRAPTTEDTGHPLGRVWVYKGSSAYMLINVSSGLATWSTIT